MSKRLIVVVVAVVVLVSGTAVAQTVQRFSDVPADHPQADAIHWAADVGLTVGYEDGTFRPETPLPRWHAVTFMERFYDTVLDADESDRFSRGDMMALLHTIHTGVVRTPAGPAAYLGFDYGDFIGVYLEPGLYRFVASLTGTGSINMQDHGTDAMYTFDRDADPYYLALGCGYAAEQVQWPPLYQWFSRFGRYDAGTLAYQRLMACPPELVEPLTE